MTHQKSLHMGQKFQCSECDYESSYKRAIVTHQQSVHFRYQTEQYHGANNKM